MLECVGKSEKRIKREKREINELREREENAKGRSKTCQGRRKKKE